MTVTIVSIVIGAFFPATIGLLKGLEDLEVGGQVETIQTTALLGTARILRVLETCHSNSRKEPSAKTDVENSEGVNNNNNNNNNVAQSAQISLTLSRNPSLSSIASGRSSGIHPVSAQSCCM